MVSQRNRVIENLIEFIELNGVEVNLGKNKARGNKGIFISRNNKFRIDLSKLSDENEIIRTLIHEFAHYIHYLNDKSLNMLDFAFCGYDDKIHEELVNITVQSIPKDYAASLFKLKDETKHEIDNYFGILKNKYNNITLSNPVKSIEKAIKAPALYLLKYDRIKYFNKLYSVKNINNYFPELTDECVTYIKLKSEQRKLKRINSKINRLNKYYNKPTELFARFIELYITDYKKAEKIAYNAVKSFDLNLNTNKSGLEPIKKLIAITR